MTEKRVKLKKINNESIVGTGNISVLTSHQNISGKEDTSNKVASWSSTTTDTHYPSEKLVKDSLDGKLDKTHTSYKGKNVVTNASTGAIEFEDKPTIPSASSTTPSADTTNGSVGTGTTWARSNHTHPKSSLYAESSHTHSGMITTSDVANNLTTTASGKVLDARQGKELYDMILGLIEEISNIQTGGSYYHIEFDSSSYSASGGSVTVSCTLQENYAPKSGATVTFTATGISQTATTNSNGVATATITGLTSDLTLTCTYSNVSDTCTITIPSYLFYDACDSATGLSDYGSSVAVRGSGSSMSMSYDSTENAYKVSGSGNWYSIIPIPILNDEDEYTISADFKVPTINETGVGFCIDNRNDSTSYSYSAWLEGGGHKFVGKQFNLNTDGTVNQHYGLNTDGSTYYRIELIVNGSTLTGNVYNGDNLLSTDSTTLTVNNRQVGIFLMTQNGTTNSACYVKNIKAEAL